MSRPEFDQPQTTSKQLNFNKLGDRGWLKFSGSGTAGSRFRRLYVPTREFKS